MAFHPGHQETVWLNPGRLKLRRAYGRKLKMLTMDTATLHKSLHPGAKQLALNRLLEHHGIEITNRHTAPGDAYMTAQLWITLLQTAQQKGVSILSQLLDLTRQSRR